MVMTSADTMPMQKEGVQGQPDSGAAKLASMFRKKKKQMPAGKGAPMAGVKC